MNNPLKINIGSHILLAISFCIIAINNYKHRNIKMLILAISAVVLFVASLIESVK
jgi:hypothetical protein